MRQTQQDLQNEGEILAIAASKWGSVGVKLPEGGKYRLDAVLLDGSDIKAWVEIKDYSKPFIGLNIPKYLEGMLIAQMTGITFLFIIRLDGRVGYIKLHDGLVACEPPRYQYAGGTPKGREPLPDDVEPMAMFTKESFKWIN